MDRQRTLLDVIAQLGDCLSKLDQIGAGVAAAHLSACLDALAEITPVDSQLSDSE